MLKIIIKGYILYLAISLLLILPALNVLAPRIVQSALDRELQTEIILFNPFTLSVEVRKAALPEHDGTPFIGFSYALVNLSLESIWNEGWVFDEVRIDGLYADIHRLENGDFNFSDMLAAQGTPAPAPVETDSATGIPGLTVREFFFHSEWIKFTDEGRERPFSTHFDGLELKVNDLSTVLVEGKPYSFQASAESGGTLSWEGSISIPGAHSEGFIALSNISLIPVSRFLEPWVRFELKDGQTHIEGRYSLDWNNGLDYQIEQAELRLTKLDIQPQDVSALPETGIKLSELLVTDVAVDGTGENVRIGAVNVTGLDLLGWSEGSDVSLAQLFMPRESPASSEPAQESPWTVDIAEIVLSKSSLGWRSEYTQPPMMVLTPLEATVSNLKWPPEGSTDVSANITVNDLANLQAKGALQLADGNGALDYALDGLPLAWFNPNLPSTVNASIDKGSASVKGDLTLAGFIPSAVNADGEIADFSINIKEDENTLTSWDSVRWEQLEIDLTQKSVSLAKLFLTRYSGRLHIFKDGTINSQRALMDEAAADDAPAPVEEAPKTPWSVDVPSISITDSSLDFMDESLPITFRTVIGGLNGSISGISTSPEGQTTVDLDGSVDGYAPVKLAGTAKPFATPPAVDLGLDFDGIDLVRLTPYSGTYAGYAIDRGILTLNLEYKLEDSHLEGNNQIVINQLKLGEKVDNDTAVDLPLGLAIALLTDMNGVIDLAVPVSGNVDDPEFGLGSVIAGALVNIITKAVTAPFSLLANLVGSDEDLDRVTFPSGSAELDEAAQKKLTDLTAALLQRPGLELVITGRLHPRADRDRLQVILLKEQMIEQGLPATAWTNKDQQWAEIISARYEALTKEIPATDGSAGPSLQEQVKRLAAEMNVPESQLEALAEERAVVVKRFLVNSAQLPAERSVIEKFDISDEANLFSGAEMKIEG